MPGRQKAMHPGCSFVIVCLCCLGAVLVIVDFAARS
jgi:hypothetical protein